MTILIGKPTILILGLFCVFPGIVNAQVVVTELMYDLQSGADGGREWVEVYNAGTIEVSLSTYRLFENGTAHKITAVSHGAMLLPGAYAIIADNATSYKIDWPDYRGPLFDSAFSLSNSGETISLRNASSTDVDTIIYQSSMGAAGDGNSLNRASAESSFVPRSPSPGAAMLPNALVLSPKEPTKAASKPKVVAKVVAESSVDTAEPLALESGEKGDIATSTTPENVAAANTASSSPFLWLLGVCAVALFAAAAIFYAKRLSKHEWNIIEETDETG